MENKAIFKPATVNKLLQQSFQDQQKTKVNNDALQVMTEMMRTFVAEAAARAGQQAKSEAAATVQTEHLEKILPQLLPPQTTPFGLPVAKRKEIGKEIIRVPDLSLPFPKDTHLLESSPSVGFKPAIIKYRPNAIQWPLFWTD